MAKRQQDPYTVLGVKRDDDAGTIKSAYRKLAQEHHPDRNADNPKSEERFKEISAAYTLISDPERRQAYDEFGDVARDPNFDAKKFRESQNPFGGHFHGAHSHGFGGAEGVHDLSDLFGDLFGAGAGMGRGRAARQQMRGGDREAKITLDLEDAALGSTHTIIVERRSETGATRRENLRVQIPAGVRDGAKIRLKGKGDEGRGGGPAGDLLCLVSLRPHRIFRREESDLHLDVPISLSEAMLGAEVEIPTLSGRVTLSVPPETDGGTRMRLRGKGMPGAGDKPGGDLFVRLQIRLPKDLDDDSKKRIAELADSSPAALREDLFSS